MVRSLSSIQKRTKTIRTTKKITNAMKLVSISKLQKYRSLYQSFNPIYTSVMNLPYETVTNDKIKLYICFFPDLGLVSSYTRSLTSFLSDNETSNVLVIGTQGYDLLNQDFNVLNEKIQSEHVDLDVLFDICDNYSSMYNIVLVVPTLVMNTKLTFNEVLTNKSIVYDYDVVYEPNYKLIVNASSNLYLKTMMIDTYYNSKIIEYTMRHMAMDKATDSANNMLDDLKLQFNRLRQERITEEIADLMAEEV